MVFTGIRQALDAYRRESTPIVSTAAPALHPAGSLRYVATIGSDAGNDCINPVMPCATIAHAVSEANPGDTLDLADGTYNESSLVITKAVNIQGQGVVVQ